jgi:membrane protein implicated in regulation of membrane protease activity
MSKRKVLFLVVLTGCLCIIAGVLICLLSPKIETVYFLLLIIIALICGYIAGYEKRSDEEKEKL